ELIRSQRVNERSSDLLDVAGRGGGQRGVAILGEVRDLTTAVGRAVQPLDPAPVLEPGHRVRQPAFAEGRYVGKLRHPKRPVRCLREVHKDFVVAVWQARITQQLRVDRSEERLARLDELAPSTLFRLAQPASGRGGAHFSRVPDLVERLTSLWQ